MKNDVNNTKTTWNLNTLVKENALIIELTNHSGASQFGNMKAKHSSCHKMCVTALSDKYKHMYHKYCGFLKKQQN